jgi:hypothetical protein
VALPQRFNDPSILREESFAPGLSRPNPDQFGQSASLDVYVDDEGNTNVQGKILSYASTDPIDCEEVPRFSSDNNFVAGLAKSIPGVPPGAYFQYAGDKKKAPEGYAYCNGGVYTLADGTEWVTPYLITPPSKFSTYIQKLPEGATFTGRYYSPFWTGSIGS